MDREQTLVELVDDTGEATGSTTVADAHTAPGRLHRAFSVLLMDPSGHVLLQRRAAAKTRFPLRWANSCCGHPTPGRWVVESAEQRLAEELGIVNVPLREIGIYRYRAQDPATGRVEHEYDHVLAGLVPRTVHVVPDPAEVAELRWCDVDSALAAARRRPDDHAPWLLGVLKRLVEDRR